MLTFSCVAVALLSGFVLGLPLLWLGRGKGPLTERDWLLAPFVGLAAGVLVLHNLVYLDVPVDRGTPWLWGSAAVLWLGLLLRRGVKPLWCHCPGSVLLVMAGVYALHGLGLFVVGAEAYVGRGPGDQYNYTTTAQLLSELPFSISWETIGQRPYLVDALTLKSDRIGVMLLQGLFACTIRTEAKHLFEATILLGPVLVVPAIYAVAGKLGWLPRRALATAALAGVLPGLTVLHLGGYLAHALGVPFLLIVLVVLHDVVTAPRPRGVLTAGLLLAGATAVYTEFFPILVVLTFLLCAGGACGCGLRPAQAGAVFLALLALMLGLNPLFAPAIVPVCQRLTAGTTDVIAQGFDWLSGFPKVWAHDADLRNHPFQGQFLLVLGVGLTALALFGLLRQVWCGLAGGSLRWAEREHRERFLFVLAASALALLPVPVLPSVARNPYQFVKLFLTVGPLLVVGLASLAAPWGGAEAPGPSSASAPPTRWLRWAAGWPLLGSVGLLALWGTYLMVSRTLYYRAGTQTQYRKMLAPEYREVVQVLGQLRAQPLVLACGPGLLDNCWLAYAARRNPIWLVSPVLNNGYVVGCEKELDKDHVALPFAHHLTDLRGVPPEALVLTRTEDDQVLLEGDSSLVWANSKYRLRKIGPGPWALRPLPAAQRP